MKQEQNLKNFVSKLIQKKVVQVFPHLYIVDKQTGPFRSIQAAIDQAEPNSIIKISQGFYEQTLTITKPLRFQPKHKNQQSSKIGVVLLTSSGVAVSIDLPQPHQECEITGIKFSHSGNSQSNLRKQLMEHEHILNIFEQKDNIDQLQSEFVNRMSPNKMENIIVLLQKGKLKITNCVLSLNYLVKSCTSVIPAIWVEKEGHLDLLNSQIKGNQTKNTIGVISRLGTLNIENSTLTNHREGAIVAWGIKGNTSKIIKNFIQNNSIGISIVGEQFKLKIISNSINKNKIGIKVGLACEPDISRNIICQNQQGIQVFSAFPNIALNKIQKNKSNGIVCHSYKKYLCKANIRKNIGIAANALNGILIQGQNNQTNITNNHMIGFNGEAGIKIQKLASPTLNNNKIYKNHRQGILVVQGSNALIQRNQITHNIQCNIAIGGINSHHSAVIENVIADSPGTGIYIIRSGKTKIMRNDVLRNLDGIIIQNSQPELRKNFVSQNKNNGVVCEQQSFPTLVQNFITRNLGVGLLLRHGSGKRQGSMHSNILVSNQIDTALQEYDKQLITELTNSNSLESDIYYPQSLPCSIM